MAPYAAPVIIVASDDKPISNQLVKLLESRGFGTIVCTTAADFIDQWGLVPGSCVIIDLDLPEGGGQSLALLFRELAGATPLLLLGGREKDGPEIDTRTIDAIALLNKPVVPLVLFAAIHEAFGSGDEAVFAHNR